MVALSFCEDEYIAVTMATCQAEWINMLMLEMNLKEDKKMELLIDNKYVIDMAKHILVAHGRVKHTETHFHFLWIKSTMINCVG